MFVWQQHGNAGGALWSMPGVPMADAESEDIKAFWRSSDVWLFSPYGRMIKLLAILGVLTVTATDIYLFGKTTTPLAAAIIGFAVSATLMLLTFSFEIYYKGGKAGAELSKKLNRLIETDPEILDERINAVQDAVARLQSLLAEDSAHFHTHATMLTWHKLQTESVERLKDDVCKCLVDCDKKTGGIYSRTLSTDEITSLSDCAGSAENGILADCR